MNEKKENNKYSDGTSTMPKQEMMKGEIIIISENFPEIVWENGKLAYKK